MAPTTAPATSTPILSATALPATSTPRATAEATLVPPVSDEPAAGICATAEGEWATAEIMPDVPSPRCLKVTGQQRLRVVNKTDAAVRVELGPFSVEAQPGADGVLDRPFGAFLAPGVHQVTVTPGSGPEVWLVED